MSIPIDPRFMDAPHWAALTSVLLRPYGSVPALTDEDGWRGWAATVTELPQVAALQPPRQQGFDSWRDWAFSFNQIVALLTT